MTIDVIIFQKETFHGAQDAWLRSCHMADPVLRVSHCRAGSVPEQRIIVKWLRRIYETLGIMLLFDIPIFRHLVYEAENFCLGDRLLLPFFWPIVKNILSNVSGTLTARINVREYGEWGLWHYDEWRNLKKIPWWKKVFSCLPADEDKSKIYLENIK